MFVKINEDLIINTSLIKYIYEIVEGESRKRSYYLKIYFIDKDSLIICCKNKKHQLKILEMIYGKDRLL